MKTEQFISEEAYTKEELWRVKMALEFGWKMWPNVFDKFLGFLPNHVAGTTNAEPIPDCTPLIRAIQADALREAAEMVFVNARVFARGDQEFAAGALAKTSNEILARADELEK